MAAETKSIGELAADLGVRRLAFADAVLNGMSYKDAYRQAYDDNTGGLNDATCRANGSRLMGHPKVRAYIEAVYGESVDRLIVTRAELLASLRDVAIDGPMQGPGAGARVSAAKILLDQLGEGVPVKVQHSGPQGKPIQHEHKHSGLTDEQLESIRRNVLGLPE